MNEIFKAIWFQITIIPSIFVLLGVYANKLSRRDNDDTPMKNNWSVATTVLLMTFSTVSADMINKVTDHEITSSLAWMLGIICFIFVSIDHDRYRSWEKNGEGYPTNEKSLFMGIILPNIISLLIFISYQLNGK